MSPLNDASAHLIFLINGGVALVAAATTVVGGKIPVAWGVPIGGAIFAGLTACLLSRKTAIVAAVLGSSLAGLVAGAFGSGLTSGPGSWFVAGLAGVSAFVLVLLAYRRFVRATTGGGELEGRFAGTFNERDEKMRKGRGAATVIVAPTEQGDHDLRVTGLVVGGVTVDLFGKRRGEETVADLSPTGATVAPFQLLRGKASIHGRMLIVDLEGSPFGSYVFTGFRHRAEN